MLEAIPRPVWRNTLQVFASPVLLCTLLLSCSIDAPNQPKQEDDPPIPGTDGTVRVLEVIDGLLVMGGDFSRVGSEVAEKIAVWDGSAWTGYEGSPRFPVTAITGHNGRLVAGSNKGGLLKPLSFLMQLNGNQWELLEDRQMPVNALTSVNGKLYLGGPASWALEGIWVDAFGVRPLVMNSEGVWSPVGGPLLGGAGSILNFHSYQGDLMVLGAFRDTYDGSDLDYYAYVPDRVLNGIAVLEGERWFPLGEGFPGGAITAHEYLGILYVGGGIRQPDSSPLRRWDGEQWTHIQGIDGIVTALTTYEEHLIVGGQISVNGFAANIGAYNGTQWIQFGDLAGGLFPLVRDLAVFNGKLFVGGQFESAGDVEAHNVAIWDGESWDSILQGTGKWKRHF